MIFTLITHHQIILITSFFIATNFYYDKRICHIFVHKNNIKNEIVETTPVTLKFCYNCEGINSPGLI